MTATALPFIPYARVSRVGDRRSKGDRYISLSEQMRTIDQLAQSRGVELLDNLITDEDFSGKTAERPGFRRALAMIKSGEAAGIVAAHSDRFMRNMRQGLDVIAAIEDVDGEIICSDGDLSLKRDKIGTTMRLLMNENELDKREDHLDKTVRNAIERGVHLQIPFGYRRSDGRGTPLALDPIEAPIVERAFEMRASGMGWVQIAKSLNAAAMLPRKFERKGVEHQPNWTQSRLFDMIKSKTYLGIAHNGERETPDAHPAIVTEDLYKRANRARGAKRASKTTYLLTGLVRCSLCGKSMTYFRHPSGKLYLRCGFSRGGGDCPGMSVAAEPVEQLVVDEWKRAYADWSEQPMLDDTAVADATVVLDDARAKLSATQDFAISNPAQSDTERELIESKLVAARDAVADAERQLRVARAANVGIGELPAEALVVDAFDLAPIETKRHWLSLTFAFVAVRAAREWREPAIARTQIVERTPGLIETSAMISAARSLDWAPASAGVQISEEVSDRA